MKFEWGYGIHSTVIRISCPQAFWAAILEMASYGVVPPKNIWEELLRHVGYVCKILNKILSANLLVRPELLIRPRRRRWRRNNAKHYKHPYTIGDGY